MDYTQLTAKQLAAESLTKLSTAEDLAKNESATADEIQRLFTGALVLAVSAVAIATTDLTDATDANSDAVYSIAKVIEDHS